MEEWEKKLRDKLELELDNQFYEIGYTPYLALTGKSGKINYEVELQRKAMELINSTIKNDLFSKLMLPYL